MQSLILLLALFGSEAEPTEIHYSEPTQIVWAEPEVEPAKPTAYSPPFRNQWTWPGGTTESLRRHLAQENHRLDPAVLASMSHAELVVLHNSDHDGLLDRSRYVATQIANRIKSIQIVPQGSQCPGGVCPTGNSFSRPIVRRVFFRRR